MHRGLMFHVLLLSAMAASAVGADSPDFARDVRPILNEHCLACHGPDQKLREAGLRLDELQNAFVPRGDQGPVILPGNAEGSEFFRRITADDPEERMPPLDAEHPLSPDQIDVLRRWIEAGAEWPVHWAYRPIEMTLPASSPWSQNAIDGFTFSAMQAHGLAPSPEASREMLIRRVTLDLTGLPPTPDEIEEFVRDPSPNAYERLVDRLLASPRYGERMAILWLDAVRYADTHGYHADSHRDMWLWRAWVINALNQNMPFDQFTIEQLAGDLLPNATNWQRLATGLHRNTMLNAEEGAIADEYLVEYVADRVETTATVWLAQTLHCARCHDHKYEPYTQRDFYRLFAYFNNVSEKGLDGRQGNAAPVLFMPAPEQQRQLDELEARLKELDAKLAARRQLALKQRGEWEPPLAQGRGAVPPADSLWHVTFDQTADRAVPSTDGRSVFHIEGQAQPVASGKFDGGLLLNGSTRLVATDPIPTNDGGISLCLWVFPTTQDRMALAACGQSVGQIRRWQLLMIDGRLVAQVLFHGSETPWLVASANKLALRRWQHVILTCQSLTSAPPVQIYVNGQPIERGDAEQPQTLSEIIDQPLHLGASDERGFRGLIDDARFFPRTLNATEAGLLAGTDPIGEILRTDEARRTREQSAQLLNYYLDNFDSEYQTLKKQSEQFRRTQRDIMASVPTTMVMDERQPRRPTYILDRGNYQSPGEEVEPGVPAILPALPTDAPANRLALAEWLVARNNPLTARVMVNRLWQLHFGRGIVATPDDFGARGAMPTHPELLDWLAAEFIESGWDVKALERTIVTSATYRQTSECDAARLESDPDNRWLSRGARLRLQAELIRDNALAASGLLEERLGGPSVYPYQPPGLWEELAYNQDQYTAQRYRQSHGADLYRRSVYTFWKRTSPPPAMAALDAPNRERCVVQRARSNTALQALVLMNDPTFVEAARQLAERVMDQGPTFEKQVEHCFLLLFARAPQPRESELMKTVWEQARLRFREKPDAAQALLATGESPRRKRYSEVELAAWTIVALTLLNTDEAITRP